ncbi:hypothetical protein M406DRAFT_108075 [Cryphonectria parasitica EP155]|uniref:Uncharacterized protein n=1 Tax=Cryphonectria parasitica (strain ATCC 38755 / EP155) TaxID=660469 RepID=A0A9P4XY37_CRYP1|nr:uncharacterized protein M406DRAFT_108075 [Cryphonectria parasitica EP155]KAF3762910.1 hypothetical protein M406DRAFT_108075 [Cryphonectria parasitica EP155]
MDGISTAASLVALLQVAAQSCKFILGSYEAIAGAPGEIHRLATAWTGLPAGITADAELRSTLGTFIDEVREAEKAAAEVGRLLAKGGVRGWLARVNHAMQDRRLVRFRERVTYFYAVFLNETQVLEIAQPVGVIIPPAVPLGHNLVDHAGQLAPSSPSPPACGSAGLSVAEVGMQPKASKAWTMGPSLLRLRHGHAVFRQGTSRTCAIYTVLLSSWAYQVSLTVFSWKVTLTILGCTRLPGLGGMWMDPKIRVTSVVPDDWPIFRAIKEGDCDTVRELLVSRQVCITDTTRQGESLLHVATRHQKTGIAQLLLHLGADVNATDDLGVTPLHLSIRLSNDLALSKALLASGADLARRDLSQRTPLHHYFSSHTRAVLYEAALHSQDSDLDALAAPDDQGMRLIHYLAWTRSSTAKEDLLFLAQRQQLPAESWTLPDSAGRSLLHLAAERGNIPLMRHLLRMKGSGSESLGPFRGRDRTGCTALHCATRSGRAAAALRVLIEEAGFDLHESDRGGSTALHHAAANGRLGAAVVLLELGAVADLTSKNARGKTPLNLTRTREMRDLLEGRAQGHQGACEQIVEANIYGQTGAERSVQGPLKIMKKGWAQSISSSRILLLYTVGVVLFLLQIGRL